MSNLRSASAACVVAVACFCFTPLPLAADFTWQHEALLSAPDCVDASHMVAELGSAPLNATYLRVQHIGDPGTAELEGEIGNAIHWDVGSVTGLHVPPSDYDAAQRGFRDQGPPDAASAFQLWCNGAGFYLDTAQFNHSAPVELAGPSVSIARDLEPARAVFRNGTSALTLHADVAVPAVRTRAPPVVDGTAQVSFFYYARDVTTGTVFAHVIALFDNREPGIAGAGEEGVSADAYTPFADSPLREIDSRGATVQFVTVSPGSERMHLAQPWAGRQRFVAHVTYAQFERMLAALHQSSGATMSPHPEDYRVTLFGVLGEVFPGTTPSYPVALGASVTDLTLRETFDDVAPVPVVEFYNGVLGHYFITAQPDEIDALDHGGKAGWQRTGYSFLAYPVYVPGAQPVCRFYIPPGQGDSHFFSASASECAQVRARFSGFVAESPSVMYTLLPDLATGACATRSTPVYRVWNARTDSNHRYVTDRAERARLIGLGYIAEGYGDDAVAMCAPAADDVR